MICLGGSAPPQDRTAMATWCDGGPPPPLPRPPTSSQRKRIPLARHSCASAATCRSSPSRAPMDLVQSAAETIVCPDATGAMAPPSAPSWRNCRRCPRVSGAESSSLGPGLCLPAPSPTPDPSEVVGCMPAGVGRGGAGQCASSSRNWFRAEPSEGQAATRMRALLPRRRWRARLGVPAEEMGAAAGWSAGRVGCQRKSPRAYAGGAKGEGKEELETWFVRHSASSKNSGNCSNCCDIIWG